MIQLVTSPEFAQFQEEYAFHPQGVIHVGAGEANELCIYGGWDIQHHIWVEALPEKIPSLQDKLTSDHIIHNSPLWEEEGIFPFYRVSPREDISSFLEPNFKHIKLPQEQKVRVEPLQAFTLDDDLWYESTDYVYDLLTLDCQGAEKQVLLGGPTVLSAIQYVLTVIWKRQVYKGCLTVQPFDAFMVEQGFTRTCSVWDANNPWGWAMYARSVEEEA